MAQLMSIKKNVDVQPGAGVPAIFHCSQGDKGTRIILGLLNNNDSYTIPEGTTAIIRGSRADGTLFTEITADIDTTTEIKFNLTEDMTSVAGPVECEAVMSSGTANVIGTANFIVNVEKSPASVGSVFPATDAAETWLIDELTNLDISGLDNESVVDAINNKASESTIAPEFSASASYTAGQYVYKNGVLYRFTSAHTGAWIGTDAVVVTVGGEITDLKADLAHITSSAVPTTVRQAIKTLFETGGYADTGLTDEMAVISSWASQVTAITLNQSSISLNGSATSQLVATTTPTGGTVTWSSSDTSVATVSSNGLVTGVGNGTATITATSGDVSATCTATVSGFKSLVSISAVYTQSGTVYDTDSLDDLKVDLVVTGLYDDQSTETITNYTLSGTLTVGTSTITVSYGGKTTTFNVTVTDSSAIQVTYTQGSVGSGNTDANRVSGVIDSDIHFDDGETLVITITGDYSIFPLGMRANNDKSVAGTRYDNNMLNIYAISDSGYIVPSGSTFGTIKANGTGISGNTGAGWKTSPVTYTYEKPGAYGYTFTGLGFLIKKNDETNITPSEISQIISVDKVVSQHDL